MLFRALDNGAYTPNRADSEYANMIGAVLQGVAVAVTTSDEIGGTADKDVYEENAITLTATVTPNVTNASAPTGAVRFYYAVEKNGAYTDADLILKTHCS